MTNRNENTTSTGSLFADEHFQQTDREPVDIWGTPPSFTQDDGAVKVWTFDKKTIPRGLTGRINVEEWPNDASVQSLKNVLQPDSEVGRRFFLSPKACSGILRRAEKRGCELPQKFKEAAERVASLTDPEAP
ncbi:hypothetical protein G6L24_07030 [Agrobacterium tumefaciens]|uniref:hypothetical protein n=1 Tax=Agrobacterium tumefaciens TaxID=358 RepID=UPI000DE311AB|nr:hypothetical protein [Agrobacterium tumefaciens]